MNTPRTRGGATAAGYGDATPWLGIALVRVDPIDANLSQSRREHDDGTAAARLRFAPWKNGLCGAHLTIAAAAGIDCGSENNRLGIRVCRCAGGESGAAAARRAFEAVLAMSRDTVLKVTSPAAMSPSSWEAGSGGANKYHRRR